MTASLSSKWAVDQTIYNQVTNVDNAVTVHLGNNTYTLKEKKGKGVKSSLFTDS